MADISTPAVAAASGVFYGSAIAIGVPPPLALPVALLATVGALLALSTREKQALSAATVFSALAVFSFSWCLGAFGGAGAAALVSAIAPAKVNEALPPGALAPFFSLVIAAYGQSNIAPFLKGWMGRLFGGQSNG